jgi:hypothetical protein
LSVSASGALARHAQVDEDAVAAVVLRVKQRLVGDRQDAAAVLAGALGDELLDPQAEARDGSPTTKVSLSRPWRASSPIARPSHRPGLLCGRVEVRAGLLGERRALEHRVHRRADQRRRHEAEQRQRRVAPADVRIVLEARAEAVLGGQLKQRAARVGDRDEVLPSGTSEWKCLNSDSVSIVPPDLVETTNSVFEVERRPAPRGSPRGRSSRARAARAPPPGAPKVRHSTSGARLDPPIPSSTASV